MDALTELPARLSASFTVWVNGVMENRSARQGQGAAEYILILAGIALVIFLVVSQLGDAIKGKFEDAIDAIS